MKNLVERLKSKGYKITNQRRAILEVFMDAQKHLLTAAEVYEAVAQGEISINFSTVYRNLEILTEASIVVRHNLDNGVNYYELDIHGHHHHLICLHCGVAKRIYACPVELLKDTIEAEDGFTAIEHKLEIYGYCRHCKQGSSANQEGEV